MNYKKITKMRRIKSYEDMSKEGLLIVLLKKENPDHNDPDYEGIWNVKNLFDESMKTITNQ